MAAASGSSEMLNARSLAECRCEIYDLSKTEVSPFVLLHFSSRVIGVVLNVIVKFMTRVGLSTCD